jgi:hypothetical protein
MFEVSVAGAGVSGERRSASGTKSAMAAIFADVPGRSREPEPDGLIR